MLIPVILIDNTAYAINRQFHYADFALIVSVILVLNGRLISAAVFTTLAAVMHDAFLLPFSGYTVFSGMMALITALALSVSLYRENYSTRVVIIAVCCAVKTLAQGAAVFLFYTSMKSFIFPPLIIFLKIFMTTLAGAVVLKLMSLDYKGIGQWLKLKTTSSRG